MTDIDIELDHIFLEAQAQRWTCIERFLFSYFCFRENYLTSKGKPDWESARHNCMRSSRVTTIENGVLEPFVPHSVIIGEIKRHCRDGSLTRQALKRILNQLLDYALIAPQDKAALKAARLNEAMPTDWYHSASRPVFQRLDTVNITLVPSRETR
ncbi:hypothetical protein GCM10007938_38000 [Vibrio zhanjiangensis]|uniref:Uncharacterized protein n=1 Tax=Vibrio zhanjiangensis TaxID=1046128 RepID=A0ABQ6F3F0_9VIBR|nr:hypothetical protein [Vibrio zhanjiangensis]GLT20017.1 hypothetical protein GCM10007938_38000 [Vibrio zhanjiangensis]